MHLGELAVLAREAEGSGVIKGLGFRVNYLGVMLRNRAYYGGNGKENGNYCSN